MFDSAAKDVSFLLFDVAAVVHMVTPTRAKTLDEYTPRHIIPFLKSHVTHDDMTRIDAIWDMYPEQSVKSKAQAKRGERQKTRVLQNTLIPKDWQNFRKNRENKINLFALLSESLAQIELNIHTFSDN